MNTLEKIRKFIKKEIDNSPSFEGATKSLNGFQKSVSKTMYEPEDRFLKQNNNLTTEAMLPYLSNDNLVSKIHIYPSLESTNKTAKEMALNGHKHGTVVLADTQTAGKGRYGRQFHSPSGSGLYMSIILEPEALNVEDPTVVTAFAAVVVCEAIMKITQKKVMIKWVNDIFLDGIKVCGILTEAITNVENQSIHRLILGIGINFSTRTEDFPEEIRLIAGSLYPDGKILSTRNRLAAEIINNITTTLVDVEEVFKKYKSYSFILGKKLTISSGEVSIRAI